MVEPTWKNWAILLGLWWLEQQDDSEALDEPDPAYDPEGEDPEEPDEPEWW